MAIRIFNYTGRLLGEALADFITFSAPEAIVLFGGLARSKEFLTEPILSAMNGNVLDIWKDKVKLVYSSLKESDAAILGASALYMKEGKDVNGKVIPRDSLKYYLEHSPEFIGTAKSMRFKLLENKTYVSSNPETGKSRVTTAMVFDYDALKVNYGIDLDISTDTLEIGDNRTAASAPPSVTEPAEAVDAELWEE